ncbi:MAG: hypothetical protein M3Q59_10960 [Actinomycetota bacterium]|nr:hypothetical protein [Actinomycetota bacterium]
MSLEVRLIVVVPLCNGAFGNGALSYWPVGLDFVLWAIRLVRHSMLLLFGAGCAVLLNKTWAASEIFPARLQICKVG